MSRKPLNYPAWDRAFATATVGEVGGVAIIALLWILFRALGFDLNPHTESRSVEFILMFIS